MIVPEKSKRKSATFSVTLDSPTRNSCWLPPITQFVGRYFRLQLRCRSEYLGCRDASALDSAPFGGDVPKVPPIKGFREVEGPKSGKLFRSLLRKVSLVTGMGCDALGNFQPQGTEKSQTEAS